MERNRRGKEAFKRLLDYVRAHIWLSLISATLALFLLVVLIFQNYLKNQYLDYLMAETWKTEKTVLSVASVNLNSLIRDCVYTASTLAVDKSLYAASNSVIQSGAEERAKNNLNISSLLGEMCQSSSNITTLSILTEDGQIFEYSRLWAGGVTQNLWGGENSIILNTLYEDIQAMLEEGTWPRYLVSTLPSTYRALPNEYLFHLALPLKGVESSFEHVHSMLVVSFRLDNLIQSSALDRKDELEYIYGYVTDQNGVIIYHEDASLIGTLAEDYITDEMMDLEQPLDYFGWTAHMVSDATDIHNSVEHLYRRAVFVYICLLVFCFVVWQLTLRRILAPIDSIGRAMEEVRAGRTDRKIPISGTHELWQLAQRYNAMIDALLVQQEQVERSYQEKVLSIERRNRAEREALESQINAHFLCNTLNTINYSVMEAGNSEVSTMLKSLSNMLYYTFSRKARVVTIGQEMEWVREYLYLQKCRLMDRFEYEITFPEEYDEWPCCKLFLQPFVENSIIHGFERIEQGGRIQIEGYPEEGGLLVIRVSDNGCGIAPEISQVIQTSIETGDTLELAENGSGIGIRNVVTRMRMYFGKQFRVRLETAPGAGTCFTFWLPIPENPEEHATDDQEGEMSIEDFDCGG